MPRDLVPDTRLPDGIYLGGISTGQFYRLVRSNATQTIKGSIARFHPRTTVELKNGAMVDADLVIFATGWRQSLPFLDERLQGRIQREGRFFLYRMIVPIGIKNLGFVGYNSSTACQLTAEISAHWFSDLFLGVLRLPDRETMERETKALHRWLDATMPDRNQGFFIGPYVGNYIDELMRDMGLKTRRASNAITETFFPLWPSRYGGVQKERQIRRQNQMAGVVDGRTVTTR